METKIKILNKQTALIALAFIFTFFYKFIPIAPDNLIQEFLFGNNEIFQTSYWMLGIFGVITILYYVSLKDKINFNIISLIFKISTLLFCIGFLLTFLFAFWKSFNDALFVLPCLIVSILFYWAIKLNNKLNNKFNTTETDVIIISFLMATYIIYLYTL